MVFCHYLQISVIRFTLALDEYNIGQNLNLRYCLSASEKAGLGKAIVKKINLNGIFTLILQET